MKVTGLFIILIITACTLSGQNGNDSLKQVCPDNFRHYFVPALLLSGSVILYSEPVKMEIQRFFPNTTTRVDDWLRYAPAVELYVLDIMGYKHRNNVGAQTVNLGISQLIAGGLVTFLKRSVHARRPSGGIHSWPSGHTSAAFVGAAVLYHEFRETEPLLAYSGFALAAATGFLRVTNDAHWLPDVMAGAAVGMAVTYLVCQINPGRFTGRMNEHARLSFIRDGDTEQIRLSFCF